jgi:hypothetical protein
MNAHGSIYPAFHIPPHSATEDEKTTIRDLCEQLDQYRKERPDRHDDLTMTALYNVLKKERCGEEEEGHVRYVCPD